MFVVWNCRNTRTHRPNTQYRHLQRPPPKLILRFPSNIRFLANMTDAGNDLKAVEARRNSLMKELTKEITGIEALGSSYCGCPGSLCKVFCNRCACLNPRDCTYAYSSRAFGFLQLVQRVKGQIHCPSSQYFLGKSGCSLLSSQKRGLKRSSVFRLNKQGQLPLKVIISTNQKSSAQSCTGT